MNANNYEFELRSINLAVIDKIAKLFSEYKISYEIVKRHESDIPFTFFSIFYDNENITKECEEKLEDIAIKYNL